METFFAAFKCMSVCYSFDDISNLNDSSAHLSTSHQLWLVKWAVASRRCLSFDCVEFRLTFERWFSRAQEKEAGRFSVGLCKSDTGVDVEGLIKERQCLSLKQLQVQLCFMSASILSPKHYTVNCLFQCILILYIVVLSGGTAIQEA